jgi:hypothetical protein
LAESKKRNAMRLNPENAENGKLGIWEKNTCNPDFVGYNASTCISLIPRRDSGGSGLTTELAIAAPKQASCAEEA